MREHLSRHSAKIAWFDPHNPDSIAKAVDDLFDDYDIYKKSALNGVLDATQTSDNIAKLLTYSVSPFGAVTTRYFTKIN